MRRTVNVGQWTTNNMHIAARAETGDEDDRPETSDEDRDQAIDERQYTINVQTRD